MKPFVFPLVALHKIRLQQEETEQQRLAEATARYQEALAALEALQQRLTQLQQEFEAKKRSGALISLLTVFEAYQQELQGALVRQAMTVNALQAERQAALQRAEAAMKDRKIVDKLKEKAFEAYAEAVLQEEQKTLDELASAVVQRDQGSDER